MATIHASDFDERVLPLYLKHRPEGEADACWLWQGRTSAKGYGAFSYKKDGKTVHVRAHRAAHCLDTGETLEPDAYVLHRCDNPPCCNPKHLFKGTHADNMQDALSKGRHYVGARNGRAKLTFEKVKAIRDLVASGRTQQSVADKFGIRQCHVSRLVRGEQRNEE